MVMTIKKDKTYFLSGATGTEIQRRGFKTTLPLWSAKVLFEKPELLVDIYRDYIRAGADILTTNTFRTQRRNLAKAGLEPEIVRINKLATELAVRARESEPVGREIFIAGSMAPLEDCYRPDLVPTDAECVAEHAEQAAILADTPIDFFMLETFNTIREAEAAAKGVVATGKPFWVSFTTRADGVILSGESWEEAIERLSQFSPQAILVNCVPPEVATRALDLIIPTVKKHDFMFGAYANGAGVAGSAEGWDFKSQGSAIDTYVHECKTWRAKGALIIGGCCGTTPEYTTSYSRIREGGD